ncbi:probable methyltransferase-like protein 24 [Synchiropus splendidus]|uniref:probable methyltransferase-like protein 24 n=1 Tax=Synchiropus splendidus TaxID=270530 RepID=UPI00237E044A|nr:probable methyltransferase-like protein 24 [Synchiropus splendidus]
MVRWSGLSAPGLLLRLGLLLTAVCVSLHVYLESHWQRWEQPSRGEQDPVRSEEQPLRRRVTYIHSLRRKGQAGQDSSPPPLKAHKKTSRWRIDLQPFASETRSLEDEASRFLSYITTPQVSCSPMLAGEALQEWNQGAWSVCLDPKYRLTHRLQDRHCRVYSFGLGVDDWDLESNLSRSGCEVHCFDPSLKQPHLQRDDMWLHRLSVDWRDPNPALLQRQHSNTKKLATILNDFGHRQVDVLKADMESAEWKILENVILEGVLDSVGQLLLELHLHWAGFEVGGDDPSVVRYWFSLLKELENANFKLFHVHKDPAKPLLFLHKNVLNASSAYTLSWVNTQWTP